MKDLKKILEHCWIVFCLLRRWNDPRDDKLGNFIKEIYSDGMREGCSFASTYPRQHNRMHGFHAAVSNFAISGCVGKLDT